MQEMAEVQGVHALRLEAPLRTASIFTAALRSSQMRLQIEAPMRLLIQISHCYTLCLHL